MSNNPLQHYFRRIKMYVSLPSGTAYYTPDQVEFTDNGEVGILPMTAKDELALKNPDALLNGEAIKDIIKSCVPAVKNPKKLLNNDIDVLLIAIRHATYGETLEMDIACPKCDHNNHVGINISQTTSTIGKLEPEYFVDMNEDIRIFVQPFTYTEVIKALQAQFEQYRIAQNLSDLADDDDKKLKLYSTSFTKLANLNAELISASIRKVTIGDKQEVTDKKHILEFLENIDKATYANIDSLIEEINKIGIKKDFSVTCEECKHSWNANIDFNPVNFSTAS